MKMGSSMHYDGIVLGGGITGCLTALALQASGLKTAIIDRYSILAGASLNNAGGIYMQCQHQAGYLGSMQQVNLEKLVPLLKETNRAWLDLQGQIGEKIFHQCGGMTVATNEEEVCALQKKHRWESQWGIGTQYMERKQIQSMFGHLKTSIIGACFHKDEGFVDPIQLALLIKKKLKKEKVAIIEHCDQIDLTPFKEGFTVTTPTIKANSNILISCLGAYTPWLLRKLEIDVTISSLPVQLLVTQPSPIHIPFFMRYVGGRLSVKQLPNKQVIVGGGWPAFTAPSIPLGAVIHKENMDQNWNLAQKILPNLSGHTIETYRCGLAAWTRDGLPIVGEVPHIAGLYLACGGNGFSLAPVFARCLSSLVTGRSLNFSLEDYSIKRFLDSKPNSGTVVPLEDKAEYCLPHD